MVTHLLLQHHPGTTIAFVTSPGVVLREVGDALDILGNAGYQGATHVILRQEQLTPVFFDLKTGLAGDVLQKFSNYQMPLAIVGDFAPYSSTSLRAFISESNKGGRVLFVDSEAAARERWGI